MTQPIQVAVIGAGISGLSCAHRLLQLGVPVIVLESQERGGGLVGTIEHDGFRFETGPQSFLCTKPVLELIRALNIEGGLLQGLGFALFEDLVIDPTTGVPVNGHLDDYKMPTIADVPEIVIDFAHIPDTILNNVGAKGLGEPPIVPTAAAIANAFAHATGRRAAALPLTRDRVLETLA